MSKKIDLVAKQLSEGREGNGSNSEADLNKELVEAGLMEDGDSILPGSTNSSDFRMP
jgi:hypothetical protein